MGKMKISYCMKLLLEGIIGEGLFEKLLSIFFVVRIYVKSFWGDCGVYLVSFMDCFVI